MSSKTRCSAQVSLSEMLTKTLVHSATGGPSRQIISGGSDNTSGLHLAAMPQEHSLATVRSRDLTPQWKMRWATSMEETLIMTSLSENHLKVTESKSAKLYVFTNLIKLQHAPPCVKEYEHHVVHGSLRRWNKCLNSLGGDRRP